MGIGISIVLVAVGAVLTFALERQAEGINLDAVGVILMLVGGIGLIASMLFWSSWGPYGRARRATVVHDGGTVVREREVV
jgi:hypothetical protein